MLLITGDVSAASETPEKPPREAPDPLGQFLEHEHIKDRLSLFTETQYYDWYKKADSTEKGVQIVTPVTLTYRYKDFDFGFRRAYIDSENKTPSSAGKVSTWSDTALTAAYTFKELEWPVRVSLDYNLPNGKDTLNADEKNAIMDSFLVQQTQFGEGENITPGINVTRAIGDKDTFGAGLSHSIKGEYDPNSNVVDDVIDNGNETIATLQWQHNEQIWTVIGGLIATQYSTTQRNDIDYYKKGNKFDLNLTGIAALPWQQTQGQQLNATLRLTKQASNENMNNATSQLEKEDDNSNGDTAYLSLDWSKNWRQKHTFHISTDYLKIRANDYLTTHASYDAGKRKQSYGLGYDYAVSNRSSLSLRAKKFSLKDRAEAATDSDSDYRGQNLSLNFNYQF